MLCQHSEPHSLPNNPKRVTAPFAVALWLCHVCIVPLIAWHVCQVSKKMYGKFLGFSSLLVPQTAAEMAVLFLLCFLLLCWAPPPN